MRKYSIFLGLLSLVQSSYGMEFEPKNVARTHHKASSNKKKSEQRNKFLSPRMHRDNNFKQPAKRSNRTLLLQTVAGLKQINQRLRGLELAIEGDRGLLHKADALGHLSLGQIAEVQHVKKAVDRIQARLPEQLIRPANGKPTSTVIQDDEKLETFC